MCLPGGFIGSFRKLLPATLFSTRATPRQYFTQGFEHFFLRYGALRLGLLLQMLFAAFFRFRKLGADDQILDGDFTAGAARFDRDARLSVHRQSGLQPRSRPGLGHQRARAFGVLMNPKASNASFLM
jgi:hypothetical protein